MMQHTSRLRLTLSISLDGYVAGPHQSVDEPPFHHPVFVLTHHAREPLAMQGARPFIS
jgi:hypothetical protein